MIKVGDYLYSYHNYRRYLQRKKIERETKTQWILESGDRIRKEDMRRIGGGILYYEETPKLLQEYMVNGRFQMLLSEIDWIAEKRNYYQKDRLTVDMVDTLIKTVKELKSQLEGLL